MWRWDQGHLQYFQFDNVRRMATYALQHDFRTASRANLAAALAPLDFKGPPTHSPWRQYARVLKLLLLVREVNGVAVPTQIAAALAVPGNVTAEEYFHFLARSFAEPSPAFDGYAPAAEPRYPLTFALKYLLAKRAWLDESVTELDEVIGAYTATGMTGAEGEGPFKACVANGPQLLQAGAAINADKRQVRESLIVLSQLGYLSFRSRRLTASLSRAAAEDLFHGLQPVPGPQLPDASDEILRLSQTFQVGQAQFHYAQILVDEVAATEGFAEGNKVVKSHVVTERNPKIRTEYFKKFPIFHCDVCSMDTKATYPWAERVLDLHHLLPLASGNQATGTGTVLTDLVPLCPSCHRAVHRFYSTKLKQAGRRDFLDAGEARDAYNQAKGEFPGVVSV